MTRGNTKDIFDVTSIVALANARAMCKYIFKKL
jgi:hypothetical protein